MTKEAQIEAIKEKYRIKRNNLLKKKNEALEKIKDIALDIAHDSADEMTEIINKQKKKIRLFYKIRKELLKKQEKEEIIKVKFKFNKKSLYISGLTIASIIIYASYKIYKENNKKYSKYCDQYKGSTKEICLAQYKIKSLSKRLSFLNNSITKCNFSKDPVKCKDKLDEEILKIREALIKQGEIIGKKITRQK